MHLIDPITHELNIYKELEQHQNELNISKLYQIYTHNNIFLLIKEPH